jgi:hypothetical protein
MSVAKSKTGLTFEKYLKKILEILENKMSVFHSIGQNSKKKYFYKTLKCAKSDRNEKIIWKKREVFGVT